MEFKEYKLVVAMGNSELNKEVNKLIVEGWRLYDAPCISAVAYQLSPINNPSETTIETICSQGMVR